MGNRANINAYIIILNWNGLNDTIQCVESCRKLEFPSFRIVVVDNGSDDGSEVTLKKQFPWLDVLQTGKNIGYAGGNNIGIKYALEQKADYIWLLNNDTVVDPMALAELINVAETDPSIGMTGSKILSYMDPSRLYYAGGWIDVDLGDSGHFGYGETDDHRYDDVVDTGYITGCSLLVRSSVLDLIGYMDVDYFLYFEESEWCVKAKRHGFRLGYVPKSIVYHKESVSTRKISGAYTYYMTRNRLYFMSRNGNKIRWLKRLRTDLYYLLRCIIQMKLVHTCSIVAAYWHWWRGFTGQRESLCKCKL